VLLGWNDRAELATDEYLPITPILEGLVILRVNPDAPPKEKEEKKEVKPKGKLDFF
jgi:26S proteasome regulatory subunit N1